MFRDIDKEEVMTRVSSFWHEGRLWGLLFYSYLYVILQGLRFSILYPGKASVLQHIGLNLGNHTGNILLPARVGEAIRPLYLKRWWPETSIKEVVSWSLFEKLVEMISMVLFVVIGLLYFESLGATSNPNHLLPWILSFLIFVVIAAACLRRAKKRNLSKKEKTIWSLIISFLTWNANTLGVFCIIGDLKLSFALLVTMTLATSIPLLPAGLGATQWAAVALGKFVNLAQADALIYSSTIHLVWIMTRISLGLPLLFFVWGWPKAREIDSVQRAKVETESASS